MTQHILTRHSYEATVLLAPLDGRARAALDGPAARDLAGITIAEPAGERLDQAVAGADMVIMLSYDLGAVDPAVVSRLGGGARDTGAPLGTIIVTPDRRWTEPDAQRGAVILREASDTVVVLGDLAPAIAFLQVLHGGSWLTASTAGV